jgi:hypothetical protein
MIKSLFRYGVTAVLIIAGAIIALSNNTAMNAYAQTTTQTPTITPQPPQDNQTADPQQIKNYLTQAIQALGSGNNTRVLEQVDLAEDQLESMTGTESAEDNDDEEEEGETEEGPGEDEDEPGDIDTNDEEDTP